MIADLIITTKGREELFKQSFRSLAANTDRSQVRVTLIIDTERSVTDGSSLDALHNSGVDDWVDTCVLHRENEGLGPAINEALAMVDSKNRWFAHSTHGDPTKVAPFVCYLQDDVLYSPMWLEKLAKQFILNERAYNLGFASGIESIEHPVAYELGGGMVLKDWIRATCMFARREYWMSMWPIPRLDPETGRVRAKPNDGMGSGVDWWFIRNHPLSVAKSGKKCLVIPGLLQHAGYDRSTWLHRELPESELDKAKVSRVRDEEGS